MKKYMIALVEVGEFYISRVITTKADRCTMEEAQQIARDAGYRVIPEICTIVPTTHEVQITIAVESEREEVK